uniref:Microtubule-associated protein 1B/S N-terminal domain-containing protein n=1 Tax=Naja naja TaxID=35670 RepID=A0A8C6V7W6_NAJNA
FETPDPSRPPPPPSLALRVPSGILTQLSLAGIRSWDIDLTACNLDQQLKLFVSRHSATFSDIVKGKERGKERKKGKKIKEKDNS